MPAVLLRLTEVEETLIPREDFKSLEIGRDVKHNVRPESESSTNSGRAETETERCISEMLPDHYFLNVLVLVANRIADEGLRMAEEREVKWMGRKRFCRGRHRPLMDRAWLS